MLLQVEDNLFSTNRDFFIATGGLSSCRWSSNRSGREERKCVMLWGCPPVNSMHRNMRETLFFPSPALYYDVRYERRAEFAFVITAGM